MTTAAAAAAYEWEHLMTWGGRPLVVHNPNDKPVEELPVIYGFNNGGSRGWYSACLLAEDGTSLGGHVCSAESYMPYDLGCIEGARPDRHEQFRAHYPDGYRMQFVSYGDVKQTPGLVAAIEKNKAMKEGQANG